MIDIIDNERRGRDSMIERGEIPMPDDATAAALYAVGVRGFADTGAPIVRVSFPIGWRHVADPLDHRRWHIVDASGAPRFVCFWKEAHPFGGETGRGSVGIVENDGIRREWQGRDSELYFTERKIALRISCSRCSSPDERIVQISAYVADEQPAHVRDIAARNEAEFRREHRCAVRGEHK